MSDAAGHLIFCFREHKSAFTRSPIRHRPCPWAKIYGIENNDKKKQQRNRHDALASRASRENAFSDVSLVRRCTSSWPRGDVHAHRHLTTTVPYDRNSRDLIKSRATPRNLSTNRGRGRVGGWGGGLAEGQTRTGTTGRAARWIAVHVALDRSRNPAAVPLRAGVLCPLPARARASVIVRNTIGPIRTR